MRLQSQGLAEGFLGGFRTMADYISQQKADTRADKSLSMQEAEQKDNKEYRDKTWNNTLERQGVEDARFEDEKIYTRNRQGDIDALNKKQVYSQMANDRARTGIAAQHAKIAAESAKQQAKLVDMQIDREEQQQWLADNIIPLQQGYTNAYNGRPVTERQAAAMSDKRAGGLWVGNLTDPEYVNSAKALKDSVQKLAAGFKDGQGQFYSPAFYKQLNAPDVLKNMNVIFKGEVNRNLNYVDESGKRVVGKEISGLVPIEDGRIAMEVTPVYEDGTKGQPKPVTQNRSHDPNDPVRAFSVSELAGVITARGNLAYAMGDIPESLLQQIKVIPEQDVKGYRKAMADEIANNEKENTKIRMGVAKGQIPEEEADNLIAANNAALQSKVETYKSIFGMRGLNQTTEENPNRKAITDWVGNDPQKQQYLQAILNGNLKGQGFNLDTGDVKKLDELYKIYQTERKSQSLEQAALQEKVNRATRNQTRY